ncbi:alpha/beta fold hydrolase [Streptomyces sp. AC627_RSS907]|uniref:alpha/beta fold hydrolase n=1 Tax=Streptomyces sp. AC627_RSS907 TaxID=2823684 RepID=UPI0020B70996|nr:alpha/beta fold hydrolase [Streptomyces sp. AC627_RSS907]
MQSMYLQDGRVLEFAVRGPERGPAVLFHHGMPGSAVPMDSVLDSVTDRGYRVVTYSRAGYGRSSPLPGRTLLGTAEDCRTLMDHLRVDRYLVVGWSAGGPHALAGAVGDSRRVSGVLLIASFAPHDAERLDFVEGMGMQNTVQFGSASKGEGEQRAVVSHLAAVVRDTPADLASGIASLLPPPDVAEVTGAYGADSAVHLKHALAAGNEGWVEDLQVLTRPWGFDLGDVTAPVELWHGDVDRMVPVAHGQWLAGRLPTARAHIESGHGHISIAVGSLGDKLDLLRSRTS